jgi:hypothetical protein
MLFSFERTVLIVSSILHVFNNHCQNLQSIPTGQDPRHIALDRNSLKLVSEYTHDLLLDLKLNEDKN